MSDETGPSDEQLVRLVLRVLAATVALVLAGGLAVGAQRLAEDDDAADVASTEGAGDPSAVIAGGPGTIGPLAGTPIPAYVAGRMAALASVRDERSAVVSFDRYLGAAEVKRLVTGVRLDRLLVAFPGGHPIEAAPDADLAALAAQVRREAADERRALQQLLPTVEDPDFIAQYRADIARLERVAAAGKPVDAIVHGAVVVGGGDALRRLGAIPRVRLVDPGPSAAPPNPKAAWALRPEETVKVGDPATRPF